MEQSKFLRALDIFPGSDIVRKFSFRTINQGIIAPFLPVFKIVLNALSPHETAA